MRLSSLSAVSWSAEVLACPKCHEALVESVDSWSCSACGVVARRSMGFADFLFGAAPLPLAAGESMDLRRDEALVAELYESYETVDFATLADMATECRGREMQASCRNQAQAARLRRHLSRVRKLDSEVFGIGAEAVLTRIDAKLDDMGWHPISSRLALEAGGGGGMALTTLARRFDRVVFVDASLTNILLAAKACEEESLGNVLFVRADAMSLPLSTGRFDFVQESNVIEHVLSPERMMTEALRVRHPDGYYVCVSPNRMSMVAEPHFGLPFYGLIPRPLRHALIPLRRGFTYDEAGTEPLSLRQFSRRIPAAQQDSVIFFLPRRIPFTARATPARKAVQRALNSRTIGAGVHHLLNRTLLAIMPQHIAIIRSVATAPSEIASR